MAKFLCWAPLTKPFQMIYRTFHRRSAWSKKQSRHHTDDNGSLIFRMICKVLQIRPRVRAHSGKLQRSTIKFSFVNIHIKIEKHF